ncbi:MAG: PTS sugar transporter subunit IIA [Candidatus Eisenbacteria bacterium]
MIIIPAAPTATDPTLCIPELRTRRRDTVLVDLVELAHGVGAVKDAAPVVELLKCRERAGTTALGKGVAMPHARSVFVTRPILVVARSSRGIEWCEDGEPVRLVLLALGPAEIDDDVWHARLTRISALGRLQKHRQRLLGAADSGSMSALARETGAVS